MFLILQILYATIAVVTGKIILNINIDHVGNVTLHYSGNEVHPITDEDMNMFNISNDITNQTIYKHQNNYPKEISFKNPDPESWKVSCLVYNKSVERVSTVISIKSANVKSVTTRPVKVMSRDYENLSNRPLIVFVGGSTHIIQNTFSTNWNQEVSNENPTEIAFGVDVNLFVSSTLLGNRRFSNINHWKVNEEQSVKEMIGSNGGIETELLPRQAMTAIMSVNATFLEIDVVYTASVRGEVRWRQIPPIENDGCWKVDIDWLIRKANLQSEVTVSETINYVFNTDDNLSMSVFDKATGDVIHSN